MLICPETYVEMYLQDLPNEKIISKIKGIKREMAQLKKELAENKETIFLCPSPEARIDMDREYIEAARKLIISRGGDLPLTKTELKAKEFDDNLQYLEKIRFYVEYARMTGIISCEITHKGETIVADRFMRIVPSNKIEAQPFEGLKWSELIEELSYLHMGEWRSFYKPKDVVVNDGFSWSLEIEFSNATKKRIFAGQNMTPYNWRRFLDILELRIFE